MNDIKKQIQEKISDIEKELKKENDIVLKLDKKKGNSESLFPTSQKDLGSIGSLGKPIGAGAWEKTMFQPLFC